ncbi:BglG family transcription antiterminator LicT [Velocimicrobium porci]|uniref:PRD domain-containing protein n=1 Tax=Velocimicrobium porci TaxID=2606634 RepID=A0A6L5Y221_9FIRM|nr:PRD domain-containing protein [Velocimicrobium porci]MSS64917.1 PRD domain-containing protein [Velocimicrobium porci]
MEVLKVINNSFVSAYDTEGKEVVIMGKGIGFGTKPGKKIDEKIIEKIFRIEDSKEGTKFQELLRNLPMEHMRLTSDIIDYAKTKYGKHLNESIYIALTDHINFAIERYHKGMKFVNPLLMEVKQFYKSEYLIGDYAVQLIKKETGILFDESEAASIALHIVNAEYNTKMGEAMKITTMIQEILDKVKECFQFRLDEESLHYSRFVSHVKFLCQRIMKKELLNCMDEKIVEMVKENYPEEYDCSKKIGSFIHDKYDYEVTNEELMYLAIHIKRMRDASLEH